MHYWTTQSKQTMMRDFHSRNFSINWLTSKTGHSSQNCCVSGVRGEKALYGEFGYRRIRLGRKINISRINTTFSFVCRDPTRTCRRAGDVELGASPGPAICWISTINRRRSSRLTNIEWKVFIMLYTFLIQNIYEWCKTVCSFVLKRLFWNNVPIFQVNTSVWRK